MYGKIFSSMFTGSMVGTGALSFAVWSYVIAEMEPEYVGGEMYVELNAKILNTIFGEKQEDIEEVISKFCGPDDDSRSKEESGKKLVKVGAFSYRVVNGAKYRAIRNLEERRAYQRNWAREKREKLKLEKSGTTAAAREYEKAVKNGDEVEAKRLLDRASDNVPCGTGVGSPVHNKEADLAGHDDGIQQASGDQVPDVGKGMENEMEIPELDVLPRDKAEQVQEPDPDLEDDEQEDLE